MKLSLNELDREIQKHYDSSFREKPESLRQFLSDSPTLYSDVFRFFDLTTIVIKSKRKQDLLRLALLSWYFPEEIGVILRMSLKEHWDRIDRFAIEKEVLFDSKQVCLAWILSESNWNEFDFFGNILNKDQVQRLLLSLNFKAISRRKVPRYTGYCRGYRESNRGAPRSFPRELESWVLDPEVELQRKNQFYLKVKLTKERLMNFLRLVS
jgi:hypothetical protein